MTRLRALALSLIGRGSQFDSVQTLAYGVVLTSIIVQGITISPIARVLLRQDILGATSASGDQSAPRQR